MAGRLARFLALAPAERAVLVRAMVLLPMIAARLRLRGFDAVRRASRRQPVPAPGVPDPSATARLVDIATRHGLLRGNCLTRSLTLKYLLDRQGVPSELRIGARRTSHGLEAHAWVEHKGRPLNDSADVAQRFPPFPGLHSALPPLV